MSLLITNDTELMHVAAAMNKPSARRLVRSDGKPRRTGPYGQLEMFCASTSLLALGSSSRCSIEQTDECLRIPAAGAGD